MLVFATLAGCSKSTPTNELEELLTYKNSYVGDNSAVVNIINRLPAHEYLDGFELQTSQEPYGIVIHYKNFEQKPIKLDDNSSSNAPIDEVLKGNAMILFSLIKNAEIITFNVDGYETILFDRDKLSNNDDILLDSITEDVPSLQNFIESYIK